MVPRARPTSPGAEGERPLTLPACAIGDEGGSDAGPNQARMRIVSLLPSSTEILFAMGAADQVGGVTHECDFPTEARTRPALTSSLLPHELDAAGIDRHVRA